MGLGGLLCDCTISSQQTSSGRLTCLEFTLHLIRGKSINSGRLAG